MKIQKFVISSVVTIVGIGGLFNCKSAGANLAPYTNDNLKIKYPLEYVNIPLNEAKEILESEYGLEQFKNKSNPVNPVNPVNPINPDCLNYSWPLLDTRGIITDVLPPNLHSNIS